MDKSLIQKWKDDAKANFSGLNFSYQNKLDIKRMNLYMCFSLRYYGRERLGQAV